MVVYDLPFGAEGSRAAATRRARARARLAGLGHHAVPLGPAARLDPRRRATCRTPARATRTSIRTSRAPCASTATTATATCSAPNPPSYIDRNAFVSPPAFTYGNTPRTLAHDLRNPSYFNQDLSIQRDFVRRRRLKLGLGVEVFNLFNTWCSAASTPTSRTPTSAGSARRRTQPRVAQIKVRVEF